MSKGTEKNVLQIMHSPEQPFLNLGKSYVDALEMSELTVTTVFLTGNETKESKDVFEGNRVIYFRLDKGDLRGLKISAVMKLRKLCISVDPIFIFCQRYKPFYVAVLATICKPIKIVGVAHAHGVMSGRPRRILFRIFKNRAWFLGVSDAISADLKLACGAPLDERVMTLCNCIDAEKIKLECLSKSEARSALGIPSDVFVFGNVGRLHRDKNQSFLLDAFCSSKAASSKAMLAIGGVGPLENDLKEQAIRLTAKDNVLFLGFVKDAWKYFRAFDCYVSTSDKEGLPISVLEAMSVGLPVVAASHSGGASEVISGVGSIYEKGDLCSLSGKLDEIFNLDAYHRSARQDATLEKLRSEYSKDAFNKNIAIILQLIGLDSGNGVGIINKAL